jgi:2-iminobutanoate/2-iminopropanoate deaminase
MTIYLTTIANFSKVNTIYTNYFSENFPARETVEVRALPKGAHIEISVIAVE